MSGRQTRVDTAPRCGEREVTPGKPNGGSLADQREARYIAKLPVGTWRLFTRRRSVSPPLALSLDTGDAAAPQLVADYSLNHTDGSWTLWQMISLAPNMARLILASTTTTCPFQQCGFPQTRIHIPAPSTSSSPRHDKKPPFRTLSTLGPSKRSRLSRGWLHLKQTWTWRRDLNHVQRAPG